MELKNFLDVVTFIWRKLAKINNEKNEVDDPWESRNWMTFRLRNKTKINGKQKVKTFTHPNLHSDVWILVYIDYINIHIYSRNFRGISHFVKLDILDFIPFLSFWKSLINFYQFTFKNTEIKYLPIKVNFFPRKSF